MGQQAKTSQAAAAAIPATNRRGFATKWAVSRALITLCLIAIAGAGLFYRAQPKGHQLGSDTH